MAGGRLVGDILRAQPHESIFRGTIAEAARRYGVCIATIHRERERRRKERAELLVPSYEDDVEKSCAHCLRRFRRENERLFCDDTCFRAGWYDMMRLVRAFEEHFAIKRRM